MNLLESLAISAPPVLNNSNASSKQVCSKDGSFMTSLIKRFYSHDQYIIDQLPPMGQTACPKAFIPAHLIL
jgi:hypothetical protein